MNRKNIIAVIALIAILLTALTGCGSDADRIAELEAENAQLKAQLEALNGQLGTAGPAGLAEWGFEAFAWSGNNGANVAFTGTPVSYAEGQTAEFSVWLEGDVVESVPCEWDGTNYTAVVDLNAADGYCYYCTITDANGNQTEVELNTPKKPTDAALIDIETALTSYCSMMVEESKLEGTTLTLTAGYAQVQLPQLGHTSERVAVNTAELVLESDGKEIARHQLFLQEDESALHAYTAEIAGITFTVPALEDDQQLEMRMEVTLSDGQTLTTVGGSWYYNAGELFLVVG